MPTASYLAYANDHIVHDVPVAQSILGHTGALRAGLTSWQRRPDCRRTTPTPMERRVLVVPPADHEHAPDFRHATGSVAVPGDLHLVDWLDEKG